MMQMKLVSSFLKHMNTTHLPFLLSHSCQATIKIAVQNLELEKKERPTTKNAF
jgi:hypothetical protein